jgi:hypothetical protein
MNELPVEWILGGAALLALGLVLCAGTLVAVLVSLRRLRRDRDVGQRQLAVMKKALLELGRHQQKTGRNLQRFQSGHRQQLQALTQRIELTRRQQQELELRDPGNVTYSHASRLVEMGAGSEDLVANCGLSEAEARLIAMMGKQTDRVA